MTKVHPVLFRNNLRQTLRGFVHEPKSYDTAIILLHGFPGNMHSSTKRLAEDLSRRGFLVMRFDFSGTSTSEGEFEDKLISQEVKDIKYAIDALFKQFTFKKLVLAGHSTGAIDASLYAYKDKRIDKLILMGGVSNLERGVNYDFTPRQIKDFWEKEHIVYRCTPKDWVHGLKLKKAYYDEFFTLNIEKAIKKFSKPVLIMHGSEDEVVPVKLNAHELYAMANRPKRLAIINGANHGFDNKPAYWKLQVDEIVRFAGR